MIQYFVILTKIDLNLIGAQHTHLYLNGLTPGFELIIVCTKT